MFIQYNFESGKISKIADNFLFFEIVSRFIIAKINIPDSWDNCFSFFLLEKIITKKVALC